MWAYLTFPSHRLAYLLTLSPPLSRDETSELHFYLKQLVENQNWNEFNDLVQSHEIQPQIFYAHTKLGLEGIPDFLIQEWKDVALKNELIQKKRLSYSKSLLDDFQKMDIPWVILKGQSLAHEIYGNAFYKKMNDIDILVHPKNLDQISDLLKTQKYFSAMQLTVENPRSQEKYSHHWPPFFNADLSCVWGIYWSLVSPVKKYKLPIQNIWQRTTETTFSGRKALRLHHVDLLHHLCLHLNLYKSGLKEVQDIYNLVRHFDTTEEPFRWNDLRNQIDKTGSHDEVYHAFRTAFAYSGLHCLDHFAEAIESHVSHRMKIFVKKKCLHPKILVSCRSTYISRIEKTYGFFTLTESPIEKFYFLFKMWKLMLFPPRSELLKMNYTSPSVFFLKKFFLRFKAPALVSRQFVHDLGWKIHVLLIVRHHVVLLRCFAETFLRKQRPQKLSSILKKLGISDTQKIPDF